MAYKLIAKIRGTIKEFEYKNIESLLAGRDDMYAYGVDCEITDSSPDLDDLAAESDSE